MLDSRFKSYSRKGITKMRPYEAGEDMNGVSLSEADKALPTLEGGYIASKDEDPTDKWYVNATHFEQNYVAVN